MVATKPIKVDEKVKETLDSMKIHRRETYNDILRRILKLNGNSKKNENTSNM